MFMEELAHRNSPATQSPVTMHTTQRPLPRRGSGLRSVRGVAYVVTATLVIALLAACSRDGKSAGSSDYVKAYDSGRYADAFVGASAAAARGSGVKRDNAALIAGLSAQALNRNAEAEKFLRPLIANPDPVFSGEAGAAVGLIAAEQGDHTQAATLLSAAGRKLQADGAARAFMYAGDSYKSSGKTAEARGMWSLAQTKVATDSSLRVMIGDRLSKATSSPIKPATPVAAKNAAGNIFCVQVGAFSSFTNAQKQLGRFRSYGAPRVVEVDRGGQTLFTVRVGNYTDRAEADRVAKNIGAEAKVMLATGE